MTRKISILVYAGLMVLLAAPVVFGQAVRFSTHREIAPPDYATFRLGPFYSTMALTERVGYRYTTSSGSGTDYIFNNSRGEIKEDGHDFPIISTLSFRNYLIINRNMDLDASFSLGYAYYPLDSQEDEFFFTLPEEGIYGAISSSFRLTPYVYGTIYDNISYQTDYVDTRGVNDRYGGRRYERFANTLGSRMNWDCAPRQHVVFTLSRHDEIPQDDEFDDQEHTLHRLGARYGYDVISGLQAGAYINHTWMDYASSDRSTPRFLDVGTFVDFGKGREDEAAVRVTSQSTLSLSLGTTVGYNASTRRATDVGDAGISDARIGERGGMPTGERDRSNFGVTGRAALETQLSKSLNHELSYMRGIRTGYTSAFEEYNTMAYRLNWQGEISSGQFFSTLNNVTPSAYEDAKYTTWANGVRLSWPVRDWLTLNGSYVYTRRDNDAEERDDEYPENTSDYETLVGRLGTDFRIHKEITFSTYYTHYARYSDDQELDYSRDTVEAYLKYHHQF